MLLVLAMRGQTDPRAEEIGRVVVLANRDDPDSLRLARHYLEKRGVPEANLVSLPMPLAETITWRQFVDAVYQPLQDELVKRGWIDGIDSNLRDKLGRRRYSISGHKISYLVVCRGVPLRIDDDPAFIEATGPLASRQEFRTNRGAVDSELALLAQSGYPVTGVVNNPLFNREHPTFLEAGKIVRVGRLDGPTYGDAAALVDHALEAERVGLIGRAYVDIGGAHPEGDKWLEETAKELATLDFDLDVDRTPQTFPVSARFDAPVLYFGWYAEHVNGPFTRPGFRFPPGAVALHIHSFSAQTLRAADRFWCGPLVARGVTATFGNVFEPYLPLTHRPQLIVKALEEGKTLGEAAAFAIPAYSWQAVLIGDPLYRPFGVSFSAQWEHRRELDDRRHAYVVSREINQLAKSGLTEEAVKTALEELRARPGLVLAWETAKLLRDAGRAAEAERVLDSFASLKDLDGAWVPVASQVAQFYAERGSVDKALGIFRTLLLRDGLTREEKLALLKPAMQAAEKAKAPDVLALWRQMAETLAKPGSGG